MNGGEGRADPLAEVIEAQRADVVGLIEATDLAVIERIANRLGMDYVQAVGRAPGQALAMLSRWTIVESINHALLRERFDGSLLEAMVMEPPGRRWVIGVAQAQGVLEIFARHRHANVPQVIVGGFDQ